MIDLTQFSEAALVNLLFSFSDAQAHLGPELLKAAGGSLSYFLRATPMWLKRQKGVGAQKAHRIAVVLELLRRDEQLTLEGKNVFSRLESLKRYLRLTLEYEEREIFLVLFLDAQHKLICSKQLFFGSLTQVAVYPREILRYALLYQAAAFVVAHNHPSGCALPSEADLEITQILHQACRLLDLCFLDHFLVAHQSVLSFLDHGWMPAPAESEL